MMSKKIKVAILGSDTYENSKKIKNHIYLWKEDFGNNLINGIEHFESLLRYISEPKIVKRQKRNDE